jgi:hypothetical protein
MLHTNMSDEMPSSVSRQIMIVIACLLLCCVRASAGLISFSVPATCTGLQGQLAPATCGTFDFNYTVTLDFGSDTSTDMAKIAVGGGDGHVQKSAGGNISVTLDTVNNCGPDCSRPPEPGAKVKLSAAFQGNYLGGIASGSQGTATATYTGPGSMTFGAISGSGTAKVPGPKPNSGETTVYLKQGNYSYSLQVTADTKLSGGIEAQLVSFSLTTLETSYSRPCTAPEPGTLGVYVFLGVALAGVRRAKYSTKPFVRVG